MLRLVTIGFLLVAAVALIIGFIDNRPGPIYVSIVCSVLAGLVLLLFSRLSRRHTPMVVGAGGSTPLSGLGAAFQNPAFQSPPVAVSHTVDSVPEPSFAFSPLVPIPDHEEPVEAPADHGPWAGPSWFPIEKYDRLDLGDILALLSELDDDELDEVAARERQGEARATILFQINRLLGREDDQPAASPRTAPWILERAALTDAALGVTGHPQPAAGTPVMTGSEVQREEPPTPEAPPGPAAAAAAAPPAPVAVPVPAKPKLTMKAAATAIRQPVPVKKAVTKQAPAARRR